MSSSPADEQEATFLLDVPPQWMRDDEAASCAKCNSMFSLFTRRHHCRSCGKLFCADCTKQEVELPSFYMLSGPQRVCVDCAPALLELTTKASELEMTAKFYLRGISDQFVETCAEVGWRPVFEKAFYLTKRATGETRVLEMIDASKTALPLDSDKKRLVFNELIAHLKHPFLYDASTDVVDYFRDKDQLMVLSTLCRLGSVRDRIYDVAAPMRQRYAAKYGPSASARALSQKHCAYIGRHVLEALRFLVEHNIVPLSLHSGNVMVASEKPIRAFVCASALVHALAAGRAPRDALTLVGVDCTNADAVAVSRFGHLLFECAAGFEKGSMPLHRWKCSKTMRPVFDILVTIFPTEAEVPIERRDVDKRPNSSTTIAELLALEFFQQVPLSREDLELLVQAKDWKPAPAERSLLKKVPPTLPAIVEAAIKLQNKRNQTIREVMKKKA